MWQIQCFFSSWLHYIEPVVCWGCENGIGNIYAMMDRCGESKARFRMVLLYLVLARPYLDHWGLFKEPSFQRDDHQLESIQSWCRMRRLSQMKTEWEHKVHCAWRQADVRDMWAVLIYPNGCHVGEGSSWRQGFQMADSGLGGMTRKQIPAQFQEELSNYLSCLTICLLCKGWRSRSLVLFKPKQARPQRETWSW